MYRWNYWEKNEIWVFFPKKPFEAFFKMARIYYFFVFLGQGFKDVIRMPRPGPPVRKLQDKWAVEYGLPSTHAIVGVSIPFSIIYYTMFRYQYSVPCGFAIAFFWCFMICLSRIYLGMHSVLVSLQTECKYNYFFAYVY